MDRSALVTDGPVRRLGFRLAGGMPLVAIVLSSASLGAQAPSRQAPARPAPAEPPPAASAAAQALSALLDRAASPEPGTYLVAGMALEPSKDPLPVIIQADARRGPENSVQVIVSLGAQVKQPAVTRARIVAAGGATPTVFSDISGSSPAGSMRAINKMALRPGEYEMQAAVAQRGSGGKVLASLVRSRLVIPDLWRGSLAVSPLVLGDAVAAAPVSTAGSPFVFGPTAVRPSAGGRFAQGGDLHVAFRVFNWTAPPQDKPDLQVEYVFYERTPQRGQFFNKVKPQALNAHTLGERFDAASGAVNGGMSIPLAAFPFGEFQLTVRVTDRRTKQTASQDARFFVVP